MDPLSDYVESLKAACTAGASAPRGATMDNTSNAVSCSMTLAPGVVCVIVIATVLRWVLCPPKRRQLYAGAEDAPELEAITTEDGKSSLRVESYAVRAGRQVTGRPSDTSKKSSKSKPKKMSADVELEPVLWRR